MHANSSHQADLRHDPAVVSGNSSAIPLVELPIVVSVRLKGDSSGSLVANLAKEALCDNKRVLLVDLTREGNLGAVYPSTAADASLTASHLFKARVGGLSPEALHSDLAIIRADTRLMNANLDVEIAGQRLKAALNSQADRFDICFVELCDSDTPSLTALLVGACALIATTVASQTQTPLKQLDRLYATLGSAAFNRVPAVTLLSLGEPIGTAAAAPKHRAIFQRLWMALADVQKPRAA